MPLTEKRLYVRLLYAYIIVKKPASRACRSYAIPEEVNANTHTNAEMK